MQRIRPGRQVGEYRLERELGRGSFGTVYLAEHVRKHTLVAVKVLQLPQTSVETLKEFVNEARTTLYWLLGTSVRKKLS